MALLASPGSVSLSLRNLIRRSPVKYGLSPVFSKLSIPFELLRRGPLSTAIPRVSAGRIKTGNLCPGLGDPSRLLPRH